jgi:hypothetical protein
MFEEFKPKALQIALNYHFDPLLLQSDLGKILARVNIRARAGSDGINFFNVQTFFGGAVEKVILTFSFENH